jgi:hypothetical protein
VSSRRTPASPTSTAVVVWRGLLGIQRGGWTTTLIPVLCATVAVLLILRSVHPDLSAAPTGALIGGWALLTVFAMLVAILIEPLPGLVGRPPKRPPSPDQGNPPAGERDRDDPSRRRPVVA